MKKLFQRLRRATGQGLFSASLLLLVSTTIVNAGNYFFNLVLGRWLGPADFADLSLIITLFLMVTFVTATLQMLAAKFAAIYSEDKDWANLGRLRGWLVWWAYAGGAVLIGLIVVLLPGWLAFFQLSSAWPLLIFSLGLPFYFGLGVERGLLQGQTSFVRLALSYQIEMWPRLAIAFLLVWAGLSTTGAVLGLTLSIIASWGFARRSRLALPALPVSQRRLPGADRRRILGFAGPVSAVLVGQILINNSDVLIVKHFFSTREAGQYAALALVGRIVFFATWSVVTTQFPLVAQKHHRGEPHGRILLVSLAMVAVVSGLIIGATLIAPRLIIQILFGDSYLPVAGLLWLYATATALYALANVIINYWLSSERPGGSLLSILAGGGQVGGLWCFHSSLNEVVLVQVYIMLALLGLLSLLQFSRSKLPQGLHFIPNSLTRTNPEYPKSR